MSIVKKNEKDNLYYAKKKTCGNYSVNQTFIFFVILLFFVCIMLGKTLESSALRIRSKYVSNILVPAVKPISDFSVKYGLDSVIPKLRFLFLSYAKLENEAAWDSFYYMNEEMEEQNNFLVEYGKELTKERDLTNKLALELAELEEKILKIKKLKLKIENNHENINVNSENNLVSANDDKLEIFSNKIQEEQILKNKKTFSSDKDEQAENVKDFSELQTHKYNCKNPLRVLMVGDSQMRSIAGGLKRLIGQNLSIHVTEITIHSSGFVRGDYYNWLKKLKTVFSENQKTPFDVVVIFLGMNDYQNFYGAGGKVLVRETPEWEAAYCGKIRKHLEILLANTKKVYWLGMPVVRNKVYNEEVSYIEKVQKKLSEEYSDNNLLRFSLSEQAPGKNVPYTDVIQTSDGKKIKLMREDGVHYTISGGEYLMKPFLNLLYEHWDLEPLEAM